MAADQSHASRSSQGRPLHSLQGITGAQTTLLLTSLLPSSIPHTMTAPVCSLYTAEEANKLPAPANATTSCAMCRAACAANVACRYYSYGGNGVYSVQDPTSCAVYGEFVESWAGAVLAVRGFRHQVSCLAGS